MSPRCPWPLATLLLALIACGGDSPTNPDPTTSPTGTLSVAVTGLGQGASATIEINGPGGFSRTISASQSFPNVAPGSYTITAPVAATTEFDFAPTLATQSAVVTGGATTTANVNYAPTTGALDLGLAGVPDGAAVEITVSGPAGFMMLVNSDSALNRLAPGQYSVTAAPITQLGMNWGPTTTPLVVAVTAGSRAATSLRFDLLVAARSLTDRIDDLTGAQVKIIYAVPSDGVDASLDTNRTLHNTIGSWQRWFASQTAGRHVRLDTWQGMIDIAFVRLPRSTATMASYGTFLRDTLEKDLAGLGWVGGIGNGKRYAVYYDGVNTTSCGSSAIPPTLPGIVAALYLHGTIPGAPACDTNPLASSPTAPSGFLEFTMAHEIVHLLGGVGVGAPNYVATGHVNHDPRDLMYAGPLPWNPSILDVTRNNYYYNLSGMGASFNLAGSQYFSGAPS